MRGALAIVTLLAGTLSVALGFVAVQPLPGRRVEAARAALREARVACAAERCPDLARAEAAADRLETRLAQERSAWWRSPRSSQVAELARDVETAAQATVRALASQEELIRHQLAASRQAVEARLQRLSGRVDVRPDRGLHRAVGQARLKLAAASLAEERGDVETARSELAAAAVALDHLDRLALDLDLTHSRFHDPDLRRQWQGWVDDTVAESRLAAAAAVVVDKLRHRLILLAAGEVDQVFPAELGRNGLADKLFEGDLATPEGRYRVTEKRDRGATLFYRALMLDYPNQDDRREFEAARRRGLIPAGRGIGGLIEIHGDGGQGQDWTNGCVALPNRDMDRLFAAVEVGTPVTVVGTAQLGGEP
jgi:hypothetical protein